VFASSVSQDLKCPNKWYFQVLSVPSPAHTISSTFYSSLSFSAPSPFLILSSIHPLVVVPLLPIMFPVPLPFPITPFLPKFLHSLLSLPRLEVWWSAVGSPFGSGEKPQPKSNLVHFIRKIWHQVTSVLLIFLQKLLQVWYC